jgi:hypothetical protein
MHTVTSVPFADVTRHRVAPDIALMASRARCWRPDVLLGEAPRTDAFLDGSDLGIVGARLFHGGHVGEAVRPLEVGDDDDFI